MFICLSLGLWTDLVNTIPLQLCKMQTQTIRVWLKSKCKPTLNSTLCLSWRCGWLMVKNMEIKERYITKEGGFRAFVLVGLLIDLLSVYNILLSLISKLLLSALAHN